MRFLRHATVHGLCDGEKQTTYKPTALAAGVMGAKSIPSTSPASVGSVINKPRWLSGILTFVLLMHSAQSNGQEIPEVLEPWKDWVTWDVEHRDCPTLYSAANKPICFWPSVLDLTVDRQGGKFSTVVRVFDEAWVPLPGSPDIWPRSVRVGDDEVPVVERNGTPAVRLSVGLHVVNGEFVWREMPQRIAIPKAVGILTLSVDEKAIEIPNWDADGRVWLRRTRRQAADKDFLSVQVYRLIEDGIPVWLRTDLELTVSGKSREEEIGWVLPAGWKISTVESPIPVAIDDRGVMKAQVRAGKWIVSVHAFRTTDPGDFGYIDDAEVAVGTELVGLKTDPEFRISQLEGLPTIDVSQTTYPSKWKQYPVHLWDTTKTFQLVEKMRGMGQQSPEGLRIYRRMWLDENGQGFTYRDQFIGKMQQIWRLDVADGHELGAVRVDGEAQLITANPTSGASGVEIRRRDLNMEAIGRVDRDATLAATGWQTDADSLQMTLTLPPGWRTLAIFGADQVQGDWLTAWSLLDLFLLLVFSFAVFRLYGLIPGIIAFLAFGLCYHELGAPRMALLFLLIPLALLRVVGDGTAKKWVQGWKFLAIGVLLLILVPFIARQTQSVIYPQLEPAGFSYGSRPILPWIAGTRVHPVGAAPPQKSQTSSANASLESAAKGQVSQRQANVQLGKTVAQAKADFSNLKYDPKSRIQTGPAQPQWDWNNVNCIWNGPVTGDQQITPFLISLSQHRVLTVIRLVLLIMLTAILLGKRKFRLPFGKRENVAAAAVLLMLSTSPASAQSIPDSDMLDTLRERLLESPDVFPNAAEIPFADLSVKDDTIEMNIQVHAALDVAVPLPGQFPTWSPISVTLDGKQEVSITRRNGYLWVLIPAGVHDVNVKGKVPDSTEWAWTYVLRPKNVVVDAPGWKVTGISTNGVPDSQVFFVKEQETTEDRAAYDRKNFHAVVVVDRYLEIGLISKVRTTVTRLSSRGKAVSLRVPLLSGESVLTSNREVEDGTIAVRLPATQTQTFWESEIPAGEAVQLQAALTDSWVERWHLVTSPIWNVSLEGFSPIYQPKAKDLIPVWHPWPGETVNLVFSKPTAIVGDIMTVQKASYETKLGDRLRSVQMVLNLESSLAGDFEIDIDPEADVSSLKINDQPVPVQRNGSKVVVPAQVGKQKVDVQWRKPELLGKRARTSDVTLPVEASNITTTMVIPENRWILWAEGPLRGPAVRFWTILAVAILVALALGSLSLSPLRRFEWVLLAIGLTQIHLIAAMLVVGWLFLLAWRGHRSPDDSGRWTFNLIQLLIVALTASSLIILIVVVSQGLLGSPDMFVSGNGSSQTYLRWFQPRSDSRLPTASILSISVWYYRLLMLFWALWLATSLLRWLGWGWQQFGAGGFWKPRHNNEIPEATLVPNSDA